MWCKVTDLSSDQRLAIEALLGRGLQEDEAVNVQPSRVAQEAPGGDERKRAFERYLADCDRIAGRARDVSDERIEAILEKALEHVRHPSK